MHSFSHQFSGRLFFVKIMLIGTLLSSVSVSCQAADNEFVDLENPISLRRESVKPFTVSLVDSLETPEGEKNKVVLIEDQGIKFLKLNRESKNKATESLWWLLDAAKKNKEDPNVVPLIHYFVILYDRNRAVERKILKIVNKNIATLTHDIETVTAENESLKEQKKRFEEENRSLKQENERLKEEVEQLRSAQQQSTPSISQSYPHPVGRWTPWGWLLTFFGWKTQPTITN